MAAIPPSVKLAQNVSCWQCDHFQRYSRGEEPALCGGECRRVPPIGGMIGDHGGSAYEFHYYWPALAESLNSWCGRFERSMEEDLPVAPAAQQEDTCLPSAIPDEHDAFWINPWNKKILPGYVSSPEKGVCCWNCDHFQPAPDEPENPDKGSCHAFQPWAYQTMDIGGVTGYANGRFAVITHGLCFWCGQWERANRTVNAPTGGWTLCPEIIA